MGGSLDILAELTTRYGASLPDQEGLKKALLPELDESRAGVRKRAIQCLASLAASLAPASLDDLCATGEPAARGSQEGSRGAGAGCVQDSQHGSWPSYLPCWEAMGC